MFIPVVPEFLDSYIFCMYFQSFFVRNCIRILTIHNSKLLSVKNGITIRENSLFYFFVDIFFVISFLNFDLCDIFFGF